MAMKYSGDEVQLGWLEATSHTPAFVRFFLAPTTTSTFWESGKGYIMVKDTEKRNVFELPPWAIITAPVVA